MYDALREQHRRPAPVQPLHGGDAVDRRPHFQPHARPSPRQPIRDIASRKAATIDGIVGWIDRTVGLVRQVRSADLGCGPGLYATRMAERGASVTGVDFSERSIAWARNAAAAAGLSIDYRHQDYLAGDLPAAQDLIVLIYGDLCALSPDQRRTLYGKVVAR